MDCFLPVIHASDCVVFEQTEKKKKREQKKENKCSTKIKVSIKLSDKWRMVNFYMFEEKRKAHPFLQQQI